MGASESAESSRRRATHASSSSSSIEHTVGRAAMQEAHFSNAASVHVVGGSVHEDEALARALQRVELEGTLGDGFLRPAAGVSRDVDDDVGRRNVPREAVKEENTADDEALARALQEDEDALGLTASSAPSVPSTSGTTHVSERDHDPFGCKGCGCAMSAMERLASVRALGSMWHRACFVCEECRQPLASAFGGGSPFVVSGRDGERRRVFHERCYREKHRPKCCVCEDFIPSSGDGYVRFETTPYWGETSCPIHATDGTPKCDGCGRYQKRRGGEEHEHVPLPDGRSLCLSCVQSVVVDQRDAEPLYRSVLDFFASHGLSALGPGTELPPLYLCTQDVMNNVDEQEEWHHGRTAQVRGMCVSHVETVSTVYREPTWSPAPRNGNQSSIFDVFGGSFQMVERRIPRSQTQKVTAILVLSCLPRLLSGSILAHEVTHMFLRLNDYPPLDPVVEEGLCQLLALLWVEHQITHPSTASSFSDADAVFAAYVCESIKLDPSPVYGDGVRAALDAHGKVGLFDLLHRVRIDAQFPS